MKLLLVFIFLLAMGFTGCIKRYRSTVSLGNGLYVEVFNINPAGVSRDYLTDSVHFRLASERWDEEHETVSYCFIGDSIQILRTDQSSKNCRDSTLLGGQHTIVCDLDTLSRKTYSLSALKQGHRFE